MKWEERLSDYKVNCWFVAKLFELFIFISCCRVAQSTSSWNCCCSRNIRRRSWGVEKKSRSWSNYDLKFILNLNSCVSKSFLRIATSDKRDINNFENKKCIFLIVNLQNFNTKWVLRAPFVIIALALFVISTIALL